MKIGSKKSSSLAYRFQDWVCLSTFHVLIFSVIYLSLAHPNWDLNVKSPPQVWNLSMVTMISMKNTNLAKYSTKFPCALLKILSTNQCTWYNLSFNQSSILVQNACPQDIWRGVALFSIITLYLCFVLNKQKS